MSVMNTFFTTRKAANGHGIDGIQTMKHTIKSMLDPVLASRKSLIQDVKTITVISLDSDHRVVVTKVNITIPS